MALEADQVLRRRSPQLPGQESAVRVVAVRALHQAFVDAVMEGPGELLLLVEVAAVAERRLACFQEELALFRVMRIVTVRAGYPVLEVHGTRVVTVFLAILMAAKAARADFLGGGVLESKNFGLVSATVYVSFAWSVTRLAAMPFGALLGIQRCYVVGRIFKILVETLARHVFVASLAGLAAHIVAGGRGRSRSLGFFLSCRRFGSILGRWRRIENKTPAHRKEEKENEKRASESAWNLRLHFPLLYQSAVNLETGFCSLVIYGDKAYRERR